MFWHLDCFKARLKLKKKGRRMRFGAQ